MWSQSVLQSKYRDDKQLNKEEIVKIFKEIADKVESGEVTVYCKSAFTSMPFTTVIDYMEFIDKSELEFTYKPHMMAELTPTVVIHSSEINDVILALAEREDLFGEYEIKFVGANDISITATIKMKENLQFELLKLKE